MTSMLGYIAPLRDDMLDTALRIEHGAAMTLDPAHLAAREEKAKLHVPVLAVADRVEECLLNVFLVLGVNLLERFGPHQIFVATEQAAVGGVRVNPPALRIDQ